MSVDCSTVDCVKGSLRKPRNPGGSWGYRIELGIGADGRRDQKQVSGFPTKREAQAALNEALTAAQRGVYVPPSRGTLSEYLESWHAGVRVELAASAWANYGNLMRIYVRPRIGNVRLVDLTPQRIQALYAELLLSGKRDGSPLSPRSVELVHKVLHRALADAVRFRQLMHNPADAVRAPRAEAKEMTAWSLSEAQQFLTVIADDRLAALWLLALSTGMRRGELSGLRWTHINFDSHTISVAQQRTTAEHQVVVTEPKGRSKRTISVDAAVIAALQAHRKSQLKERLIAGPGWTDSGLVFVDEAGRPYHPRLLRIMFDRACIKASVPRIRLHDVRHTMATLALQAGIHPKIVQERLGHSSIAMTLDTYSHVTPNMQEDAATKIGALLRSE